MLGGKKGGWGSGFWLLLRLTPGALAKDLVQVKGDCLLLDQTLHLSLLVCRQNPHQGLRCKPVLGTLLVVALRHVCEHNMSCLVDVVDDLSKVGLEVTLGQVLEVAEGRGRDVPLPLEVPLASLAQVDQVLVVLHEGSKLASQLQLVGGDGALTTSEGQLGLLLF